MKLTKHLDKFFYLLFFIVFFLFAFFHVDVYNYFLSQIISTKYNTVEGNIVYSNSYGHKGSAAYMDVEYCVAGDKYERRIYYVYNIPLNYKFRVEYNVYFPSISRINLPKGFVEDEEGTVYYTYVDSLKNKPGTGGYLY